MIEKKEAFIASVFAGSNGSEIADPIEIEEAHC